MPNSLGERLAHAWDAFRSDDDYRLPPIDIGPSYSVGPSRHRFSVTNERSIISSIYTRIAVDFALTDIFHARTNENGKFKSVINSYMNDCMTVEANLDQSALAFWIDVCMTILEEGHAAIVPVETTINPTNNNSYDITDMRVGKVVDWYPKNVKVNLFDSNVGLRKDIILPKKMVAIVENPFYGVMNEPNSTLQRLVRKLALLDTVDEASSSGKLDLIIQLPYVIKSDARRTQAENRRKDIEMQLKGSKYGIAYTDGTERITQLNRPAENNLLSQVTYLTEMLHAQLGITSAILDGTATEQTMLNYHNRTIDPILRAVTFEMRRKFLTKTARTQSQSILYVRDPFRFVSVSDLAEIADKLTRNEITSTNEIRAVIALPPSDDPKADELRNKNIPPPTEQIPPESNPLVEEAKRLEGELQNGV